MSRVKLRDIADYTGTAISTVSAALNGTGRVSPDKAKQIRAAAEKLGFKPNLAAQLLKNHEVDIFGLIISDRLTRLTGHGVYSELQEKFLNECRAGKIRTQFELDRTGGLQGVRARDPAGADPPPFARGRPGPLPRMCAACA